MQRRHEPPPPAISEQEFEEIFQRNKTVSSSAINRAVMDASSGTGPSFVTSSLCFMMMRLTQPVCSNIQRIGSVDSSI